MRRIPWMAVAVISGLFSVMVAAAMLANLGPLRSADPLRPGELERMKAELVLRPKDEVLKSAIRDYDAALRSAWFSRVETPQRGAWLLLLGVAVTVAALKLARRQADTPFDPRAVPPPDPTRAQAPARWGFAAGGLVLVGGLIALGAGHAPEAAAPIAVVPLPPPDAAEVACNWPGFRGPAAGHATGPAPLAWDAPAGTGVLWTAELPLPGVSSPVVWNDAVYVTGSDGKTQEVTAFAASDGAKRWSCRIPVPPGAVVDAFTDTGHAAPTPATDGRRVVALFASGTLAAVSADGRLLWSKALGVPESSYSLAASPVIWQDRVLVQLDQGAADAGRSALLAFDLASGRQLWRTARPVRDSWASPQVAVLAGRAQVLTCADPWVIAYDPADGREIWRANLLGGDVASTPAVAGGLVVVVKPGTGLFAIRPDGSGEVTASHVAWTSEDSAPDTASPVGDAALVVSVGSDNAVVCLDAMTGAKLWEHPGHATVKASPVVADGRLYVTDEEGATTIIAWKRELSVIGSATLGEKVAATPAVVGGRIYLRGDKRLFCLGAKP